MFLPGMLAVFTVVARATRATTESTEFVPPTNGVSELDSEGHGPTWDVFISHASEDKEDVARTLSRKLEMLGVRVWLDENELTLGDSLSGKIDKGLAGSRYGVVILSKHFFNKDWPARELAGLVARQTGTQKVILPVWHHVNHDFVMRYSPILADALAVNTDDGLDRVADAILGVLRS